MCLIVPLLIAALVFFLVRRGKIGPPPWVAAARGEGFGRFSAATPEFEARRTLANRFANGEMSPEEFLERAAALNWTPGVDHRPEGNHK